MTKHILQICLMGFSLMLVLILQKNITAPDDSSIFYYMQNRNENCMFFSRVVDSCKNKLSNYSNGLSMYIAKRVIITTNLAACVCVSVCVQNLTNFCPNALISTPNVPNYFVFA